MKDAFGHGSNAHGRSLTDALRTRLDHVTSIKKPGPAGGKPMSSNAAAAQALVGSLKSTQAPVHDAMQNISPNDPRVGSRDYDAMGHPRTDKSGYDEYNRDLAYRGRQGNGGIGSGGRR